MRAPSPLAAAVGEMSAREERLKEVLNAIDKAVDAFEVLGLDPPVLDEIGNLSWLEPDELESKVEAVYRRRAIIVHPDRAPAHLQTKATAAFHRLAEAVEVLRNADKRSELLSETAQKLKEKVNESWKPAAEDTNTFEEKSRKRKMLREKAKAKRREEAERLRQKMLASLHSTSTATPSASDLKRGRRRRREGADRALESEDSQSSSEEEHKSSEESDEADKRDADEVRLQQALARLKAKKNKRRRR